MDPLRGGVYDQVATLYDVPETVKDAYGQPSQAATAIGQFYVEVRPLGGSELVAERQVWPTITHIIRLPYTWDAIPKTPPRNVNGRIMPNMKFGIQKDRDAGPRFFNVLYAADIQEQGVLWECRCEEKPGSAV
jgi:hypothetical protein